MRHTALLYFVGPAGAGKSTLVASLQEWLALQRFDGIALNLDPGAETIPYAPDIDVRERFTLRDVMAEYGLGPNGAQVVCADLLAVELEWLRQELDAVHCDYVLADAPGQTELFLYREAPRVLVEGLSPRTGLVMLFDPLLSRTPAGFVTQLLLAAAAHLRFPVPMFPVLTKSDLLEPQEVDRILGWAADLELLRGDMPPAEGMGEVLSGELLRVLQILTLESQLVAVSAQDGEGMEGIYALVQSAFAGGDDLEAHVDAH